MDTQILEKLGLSKNEAALYASSLKMGEAQAADIARTSSLKRPTAYKTLDSLEAKGLLTRLKNRKKTTYRPAPPSTLLDLAEEKEAELKRTESVLKSLLPTLTSTYHTSVERPIVKVFEGEDGIKKIYQDTLDEGEKIYAVLQTASVEPKIFKWLNSWYGPQRAKRKIHAQVIAASGEWSKEYRQHDPENYRTTRIVSGKEFPFQHEVNIYGDKVAFMDWRGDGPLIGFIINHPSTAATMKAWFDLAWRGAKIDQNEISTT